MLRQTALMLVIVGAGNCYAADLYNPRADHAAEIKPLLRHGTSADARDFCGKTATHYCISRLCLQGDILDMGISLLKPPKAQ